MELAFTRSGMEDRFEIGDSLGKGGVSEVFRAFDHERGQEVAIKRLLPLSETNLNEPQCNGLEREIHALSQLKHRNIVELYEAGEDEEGSFAVLEFIDGESLHDVIHEGALTYPDFYEVATQLLEALAAAEEVRLLHRDLKPGNIMLQVDEDGQLQAKLLDFGVSKFLNQPQLQTVDLKGSIVGTVDYISPEQLELQPLDPRSDLYSLGCIFYFCFAQEPPFHGGSPAETVRSHLDHDVTSLHLVRPDLPRVVSDWVMKLIERNPDDRPIGARHALSLLEKAGHLDQVPGARLHDLSDSTAPISTGSFLHQPERTVETSVSHHLAPSELTTGDSATNSTH